MHKQRPRRTKAKQISAIRSTRYDGGEASQLLGLACQNALCGLEAIDGGVVDCEESRAEFDCTEY